MQEKTAGNPFFTVQLLSAIHEDGHLTLDVTAGRWVWDIAGIRSRARTDNVVDLMIAKTGRLPASTGKALGYLACLGQSAEAELLGQVDEQPGEPIDAALLEAVRAALVTRTEGGLYAFAHDRVQEAAYLLVPEGERPAIHRRLGQLLLLRTPLEKRAELAFEIASQLSRGVH